MTEKERKELFRQLNIELCELCKEGGDFDRVRYLAIESGADIFFQGLKALSNAAKKKNFAAIDILIEAGILTDSRSMRIVASVCDYKGFDENAETKYFEMLERAISITGKNSDYFSPYINSMLIHGKTDKLYSFMERFGLDEKQTADAVFTRVIFETINNGHQNSLDFINNNVDWLNTASLDAAVSSGETEVVRYILEATNQKNSRNATNHNNTNTQSSYSGLTPQNSLDSASVQNSFDNEDSQNQFVDTNTQNVSNSATDCTLGLPSETAIYSAIFDASIEILELLVERGWNPQNNPLYLKKACRSFVSRGDAALRFLLKHGYSLADTYDGKTIYENAVKDNNTKLLAFLSGRVGIA